jgi:LPXTG-motif cell wall-anchored protein
VADLSATGGDADLPHITTGENGLAMAVWQRYDGSNFAIQARMSQDGAPWTPVVDLYAGAGFADDPHVTIDTSGLATAIWTASDGYNAVVQTRTSQNGASWSPVLDLSAAGADAFNPQVTAGVNGLTTAIWAHFDGANTVVQTSASLHGATWSPVTDLSAAGGDARGAQITVNTNGLANAIWVRNDGSNTIVQTSTSLNGAPWSPVLDLSANGRDANFPQLTVGNNGLAFAIWSRSDGRDNAVQVRTLQEEIPIVTPADPAALAKTGADANTLLTGALAVALLVAGLGMRRRERKVAH